MQWRRVADAPGGGLPAELDPNNPNDADPTTTAACATQNLVPILLQTAQDGDINLATLTGYTAVTKLVDGGNEVGVMVYDSATDAMGIALFMPPAGGGPGAALTRRDTAESEAGRARTHAIHRHDLVPCRDEVTEGAQHGESRAHGRLEVGTRA